MTTSDIPPSLRQLVIERAKGQCEYCLIHQNFSVYNHEVDHVIVLKHGGQTTKNNLALACLSCNRYKGSDIATFDPITCELVPLFHPRHQIWSEHFKIETNRILGKTSVGRTTEFLLKFNIPKRLIERQALILRRLYP
jgi:hypothetical protein